MKIVYDENNVTLEDMMQIETGRTFQQQIEFLARFVVDDDGAPVKPDEARRYAAKLSIPQARKAMREFWTYLSGAREAVNPPSASS